MISAGAVERPACLFEKTRSPLTSTLNDPGASARSRTGMPSSRTSSRNSSARCFSVRSICLRSVRSRKIFKYPFNWAPALVLRVAVAHSRHVAAFDVTVI